MAKFFMTAFLAAALAEQDPTTNGGFSALIKAHRQASLSLKERNEGESIHHDFVGHGKEMQDMYAEPSESLHHDFVGHGKEMQDMFAEPSEIMLRIDAAIRDKVITVAELLQFCDDYYISMEPVAMALGIRPPNSFLSADFEAAFKDGFVALAEGPDVQKGERILGVRLGLIEYKRQTTNEKIEASPKPASKEKEMYSKEKEMYERYEDIFEQCGLTESLAAKLMDLASECVYGDEILAVARHASNYTTRGLATRLMQKSMEYARDQGCTLAYGLTTSNASHRIFEKLGYTKFEKLGCDYNDINVVGAEGEKPFTLGDKTQSYAKNAKVWYKTLGDDANLPDDSLSNFLPPPDSH